MTAPFWSILLTRFCTTVDLDQRYSPFKASKLHMMLVLQGTPVSVLRLADSTSLPTENTPSALASG